MAKVNRASPSESQIFEFMEKFNQIAILDSDFADRLPNREFELSFSDAGDVYIDGQPLNVNVKSRYESLSAK